MAYPLFIIAEIGSNHDGIFEKAVELIYEAKASGANAVKFQTYKAEKLVDSSLPTLPHVQKLYKTQCERFKSLEFKSEQWLKLAELANSLEIEFLSTPFDIESVDLLDPLVKSFKISSGDANNLHLIRYVLAKNKPLMLSTGMISEAELDRVVSEIPKDKLTLLHCVSLYPTPLNNANLTTILYLKKRYSVPVGYSDHTIGITACLHAVTLGATILEKHFTLDSSKDFGDHKLSLQPKAMKELVNSCKEIHEMLGIPQKNISVEEKKMAQSMRRGVATSRDLKKGSIIDYNDILPLRPEGEISVLEIDQLIGKKIKNNKKKGEFFNYCDFT